MSWQNCALAATLLLCGIAGTLRGADVFWDGETSNDWQTGTNWEPQCSGMFCVQRPPGVGEDAVLTNTLFGTNVQLSAHAEIRGLTIGNGIDVNTNGFQLEAAGGSGFPTMISGTGTNLIVPHAPDAFNAFFTHQFHLSTGGGIVLGGLGQTESKISIGEPGSTIDASSSLSGNGTVHFSNFGGGTSATALNNDGTIRPRFGAMTLETIGRLDLDGSGEAGVLDADDGSFLSTNVSLRISAPLADPFHGTMRIGEGDTISFQRSWQFGSTNQAGGLIELNGNNGTATLMGDPINMNGANLATQIKVVSGTGVLDAEITASTGQITAAPNTTVRFKRRTSLGDNTFLIGQDHYDLIVDDWLSLQQSQFDWDSPAPGSHNTLVNEGAVLRILSDEINPGDNTFRGEVTLHGGWLTVNTTSSWRLEGRMALQHTGVAPARVDGASLVVGDGFEAGPDAQVLVSGPGTSEIIAPVTFRSDAELQIDDGAALELRDLSNFHAGAQVTGPGRLINRATMTVADGVVTGGPLRNTGTLNVGGNNSFGDLTVNGYAQVHAHFSIEPRLNLELQGTAPGDYDQLIVNGNATLFGTLGVDWLGAGLPALGSTFPIITATSITGAFENWVLPPLASGHEWNIQYNPTSVVLEVVNPTVLTADFDHDGDVDEDDLSIWKGAYGPGAGADADGDGDSDGRDFLAWQQQSGSGTTTAVAVPEPNTILLLFYLPVFLASTLR